MISSFHTVQHMERINCRLKGQNIDQISVIYPRMVKEWKHLLTADSFLSFRNCQLTCAIVAQKTAFITTAVRTSNRTNRKEVVITCV
jgi:hypothetical protein